VTAGIGIGDDKRQPPAFRTTLANFAPNPLLTGATGRIQFTMAREGKANVDIFDVNGRLVKSVYDGIALEGVNEAFWNGTDGTGREVASGVYFYRLRTGAEDFSKKMVVVRNGGR
jgi:flagellar hook assembly protein FlgD